MTMLVHYVAELPPELDLAALGGAWRSQVCDCREVRFADRTGPPAWLVPIKSLRPDWGTLLCEVSARDLVRLVPGEFDPARRYAAIWVECY